MMNPRSPDAEKLRARAISLLKRPATSTHALADASAALRVLYDLASSPTTAPDALALLHELQVHQVEVDLQGEELLRSRAELEMLLRRQVLLYDHAPVGLLALDADAVLHEVNMTAADLLGSERDALIGRSLTQFLSSEDAVALRATLAQFQGSATVTAADLDLRSVQNGPGRRMHICVNKDPAGNGFLMGMMQ
jgi:PAS domain S-box-containing protein